MVHSTGSTVLWLRGGGRIYHFPWVQYPAAIETWVNLLSH
jgi:hypothetical protein